MGLFDDPVVGNAGADALTAPAPGGWWEKDPIVGPRAASGVVESLQAGFQGSATGLAWRGKLPDLVLDPDHSKWWERALSGVAQIGSELPLMVAGGAAGGVAGSAAGTAVAPGPGTAAGGVLGTGAGMFALPAGVRTSLMEAYKSGEVKTAADWWNIVRETAKSMAEEGAIGAATLGAGGIAARTVGKAIAPSIGTALSPATAIKAIGASDTAAQIASMVTLPAALQGRLPDAQEFVDAAIIIGGVHMAVPVAERVASTFLKTGRTPAEQVADAQTNPQVAADLTAPSVSKSEPINAPKATEMAAARMAELGSKAETAPLTDAERAERIFLANAKPDALAEHFKLSDVVPDAKAHEESANRVYDDVLRQVTEQRQARIDAGLPPIYDKPPEAIATLVKRQVATIAAMHGVLPEDIYRERYPTILDATQSEPAAEIPAGAATFTPPEVDLFGNPVVEAPVPRIGIENLATHEVPVENLVLSKEVPQFKHAADESGVVVPLGGQFDRTGVGPIQIWERTDGTQEVISGRHRLDLAKRTGEATIPAQIHREADGFTAKMAATLDAQLNIREEQGNVADYAQYFKTSGISKESADERGLLARAKGRAGFAIARDGVPDLVASLRAGKLSDEAALSISTAAPGSERLQALGIAMVQQGKSILMAVNTMKAVELMAADRLAAGAQGDIFGFDDSAMREAAAMAKKASSMQRKISEQISAVSGASKRPELARKMGVDVADPEGIQKRVAELRQEQYLWDNWPIHPELVARLRGEEPPPVLSPPSAYSPEVQAALDAAKTEHDSHTDLIKRSQMGDKEARLKGEGMRYAALKRQITGELTAKEQAAKDAREAGNYIGKKVLVDGYEATVTANPFGKVSVEFADGVKKTVDADQIKPRDETLKQGAIEPTADDIHALADRLGVKWDDEKSFMDFTERITGKRALDDLTPDELRAVYDALESKTLYQDDFHLVGETPAELKARDEEAAAAARRKIEQERTGTKELEMTADQADLFATQGTLFQATVSRIAPGEYPKEWGADFANKGVEFMRVIDPLQGSGEIQMWDKAGFSEPPLVQAGGKWLSIDVDNTAEQVGHGIGGKLLFRDEGGSFWVADPKTKILEHVIDRPSDFSLKGFNPDIAGKLLQEHRGSYDVAERLITTFENADKSTVIHELGHHFLEDLKYYAMKPNAPERVKLMWETARQEFAIPENGEISTASHEMNARSFERYLGDGDAPSVELRGVFEQFKQWMLEVYNDLKNLGAKINPEITALFDKMLATDQEIADAKELNVPRAYVAEAKANEAQKIVPTKPGFKDEQLAIEPFAEELQMGPGSAKTKDSRINAQYINGPMELKLAIQRVSEIDQQGIQAARGGMDGTKTWHDANAEVDRIIENTMGGQMDKGLLNGNPSIPHDIQQRAAFRIAVAIAKYSLQLRDVILQKGHDATVQEQFDYLSSIVRMRMAQAEFLGLRAASARALNQIKDMTPESGVIDKMVELTAGGQRLFQSGKTEAERVAILKLQLEQIMAQHFSGKSALDIAKLQKDIKSLKGNLILADAVTKATKWDMAVEGWKAGLLSGPQTPATNIVGTWSFQAMRAPIDAVAALVGMARGASPGMGETDRASMSEAIARLTGPLSGIKDGLKLAYSELKMDEPTEKVESFKTAIPGRLGEVIRFPFRLMSAGDVLTTTMYKRGEMKTLAIRQAFDEDRNPGTREFADRVQELMDSPTHEMVTEADSASTRMAFNMPGGEKTVALQSFIKNWGLQWMVPFIRTPINIAAEMIRMTPLAPTVIDWRADILKGGVARDKAIAEVVVGSGIMALTMAYAFSGQISGSGSPDPGKNRAKVGVWQPNSVLIGDTWHEIGRLQPAGTLMVLAADVANAWEHMTDEERDKVPKILAMAFSNAITNQTFLQGLTNVVHLMSEPDRYGSRFFQGLAASMVPNIIGQQTVMADPYVRQVNSMLESIQGRIPGLREQLTPQKDWLGEDIQAKERLGVVLPSREQKISEDKVRLEAARMDISIGAPPKTTHLGKGTGKEGNIDLTEEERTAFQKASGELAHTILSGIVMQPGYDAMPDRIRQQIFHEVLQKSHQFAAATALPPEKRMAYLQEIVSKIAQELQPAVTQ